MIGPSGVGKSSFLQAGVILAKPEAGHLIRQPGETLFAALARAWRRRFKDDADAIAQLIESGNRRDLVTRWRERHDQALLIVDQFEELSTLNIPMSRRGMPR